MAAALGHGPDGPAALAERVGVGRRGAVGRDRQRGRGAVGEQAQVGRQRAGPVEHDAERLALAVGERDVADRQGRVVGPRRPGPDEHGVDLGPEPVDACARGRRRHPAAVARGGRDLAVQRRRQLERHERPARGHVRPERLVVPPRLGAAHADRHVDAGLAHPPDAAAGDGGERVLLGHDHAPDLPVDDQVGAGRRLAGVAARLQRDDQRRLGQPSPDAAALGVADGPDLGVGAAPPPVPPLPPGLAVGPEQDRADGRVGADGPGAARGERQRPAHGGVESVGGEHGRKVRPAGPQRQRLAPGRAGGYSDPAGPRTVVCIAAIRHAPSARSSRRASRLRPWSASSCS